SRRRAPRSARRRACPWTRWGPRRSRGDRGSAVRWSWVVLRVSSQEALARGVGERGGDAGDDLPHLLVCGGRGGEIEQDARRAEREGGSAARARDLQGAARVGLGGRGIAQRASRARPRAQRERAVLGPEAQLVLIDGEGRGGHGAARVAAREG